MGAIDNSHCLRFNNSIVPLYSLHPFIFTFSSFLIWSRIVSILYVFACNYDSAYPFYSGAIMLLLCGVTQSLSCVGQTHSVWKLYKFEISMMLLIRFFLQIEKLHPAPFFFLFCLNRFTFNIVTKKQNKNFLSKMPQPFFF
jgi:hypothetical protein